MRVPVTDASLAIRVVTLALCILSSVASAGSSPFTVNDSVAWRHIIPFGDDQSPNPLSGTALFSPNGSAFILRITRGESRDNVVVDTLLLFQTAAVRQYLVATGPKSAAPPQPIEITQQRVTREESLIADVRWTDDEHVAFLSGGREGSTQGFLTDISSRHTVQLTHAATPVVSFAVQGDRVLYLARAPVPQTRSVQPVDGRDLAALVLPTDANDTPLELYVESRRTGVSRRINLPATELLDPFWRLWISPSGDKAIIFVPSTNAPAYWSEYKVADQARLGYPSAPVSSDSSSQELLFHTRLALIDLNSLDTKPLMDAPSGWPAQTFTPIRVYWTVDESTVVVSNTFLPLDEETGYARSQRQSGPAIAEVNLRTGKATPIMYEPTLSDAQRLAGKKFPFVISGLGWDASTETLRIQERRRDPKTQELVFRGREFTRDAGGWVENVTMHHLVTRNIDVSLKQALNDPPKVFAALGSVRRLLLDPNPNAQNFAFGHAEVFDWLDDDRKIKWRGGLLYPTNYIAGKPYPLIVQTHGFDPNQFFLDGPGSETGATTASAAQVFANSGFVVLQVEDNGQLLTQDENEGPANASGIKAAIDALTARGLADKKRVGLIGWSRPGLYVLSVLANYPGLLAAADISDSVQADYTEAYVLATNLAENSRATLYALSGGKLAYDRMGQLFGRHPLYRIGHTPTAVRIEALGANSAIGMWETYSVLKDEGDPVDLVYFAYAPHALLRPTDRLGSQGGNLDWFRFWLQEYEDAAPEKVDQYSRWRELRRQARTPERQQ